MDLIVFSCRLLGKLILLSIVIGVVLSALGGRTVTSLVLGGLGTERGN